MTAGFYTTVVRETGAPWSRKVGYLLGPFDDEPTARAAIPAARRLADAEQLAVDLRNARNAAALGEKTELRYACRHIEQAAAIIRKAGI